jgi:lipopolysaccharide export LptBFGC system permease protein LptF
VFCHSGKIEKHNVTDFVELTVSDNKELRYTFGHQNKIILQAGEWRIEEVKKHRFLYFGKKQAFEILTIESKNLVLQDHLKGEKIFFIQMPEWNNYIEPATQSHRVLKSAAFLKK